MAARPIVRWPWLDLLALHRDRMKGACGVRHRRKVPIHQQAQSCGERSHAGALMEYVITAAFLVGVVVAGFGTAIFAGYEIARFVASAM